MLRTSVPAKEFDAAATVLAYKSLAQVERAFRSLKSIDLDIRPVHHRLAGRVRAHVFLCMPASLIQGDERAVYGDKAYASEALRTRKLAAAGIEDRVMYRAALDTPMKSWQSWFNKAVAGIRAGVERRFAVMKRHYGFRRVRYLGLLRNACHLQLLCTAINLKRALVIAARQPECA